MAWPSTAVRTLPFWSVPAATVRSSSATSSAPIPAGSSRPGPQGVGVNIVGAQNASVRDNLVSGNDTAGVSIGTGGDGSAVTGNLIGTNAAGTAPIPGVLIDASGVAVFGSANVTIGGSSVADRNVISGLPERESRSMAAP